MKTSGSFVALFAAYFCATLVIAGQNGETYKNPMMHYSNDDAIVKNLRHGLEQPSSYSHSIESGLIGIWKPVPGSSIYDLPGDVLENIEFRKDGTVKYNYESKNKKQTVAKTGIYEVCHLGSAKRGLPSGRNPNVIIKDNTHSKTVIPFVDVYVGLDNRFPLQWGALLKFKDMEGNEYVFVRDKEKMQKQGYGELVDFVPGVDVTSEKAMPKGQKRESNSHVTREILAELKEGDLTVHKKNKAILRLMNEGDSSCVPFLIELSTNCDNPLVIRQNAIRALGQIGDKEAVPTLINILEQAVPGDIQDEAESEAIIRRKVVTALGYIGDTTALPVLKKVAKSDKEYQSVRELAEIAIRKIEENK